MIVNTYFLSYACAETFENGVMEFDTYAEAIEAYDCKEISGYSVSLSEHDVTGALANELRKGVGFTYTDCRTLEFA